ncbi:MAG: hypothetical protein J0M15_13155 [Deltaproteobacteria bacterium]|nr:hypothetical protein [Deltaproteobacteria bacterium]
MKNLFKFLFFLTTVLSISCTRLGANLNSKILIKMPEFSSSHSDKLSLSGDPTSLSDMNCYMVFISGPEEDLQKNICPTKGDLALGIPSKTVKFGLYFGGYNPGSEISFEVPSGNSRVIHLVGMSVKSKEICRDFKTQGFPSKQESSKPYLLGTADNVFLEAAKTIEIPIAMTFNSANGFSKCSGPDLPDEEGDDAEDPGETPGDGSNEPYLRFEGLGRWDSMTNKELGTIGQCYLVTPSLYQNGQPWVEPSFAPLSIDVSSFVAGQFYSDSGCSSPVTSLSIPVGAYRSAAGYYFKSTSVLNDVPLTGWTITGNSQTLQSVSQVVDFGYPKITFFGSDKLPVNLCSRYQLKSELFEGGSLMAPSGGINFALSDNASFYLRASNDCLTGTTVHMATATESQQFYLKIYSPSTAIDLQDYMTASAAGVNYVVSPFIVETSAYHNHVDAMTVYARDNAIVRGECNAITIRLVNFDGGAASAKNLMNLYFNVPQGAGSFYTLSDCSGAPIGSIPLVAGGSELNIGFKANALPEALLTSGQIPMEFHFGSIRIKDIPSQLPSISMFDVFDPMDPWFLSAVPPHFHGATVVGSHEFNDDGGTPNTYKLVELQGDYDHLDSVKCYDGSSFVNCSPSELDTSTIPYKYKWASSDASSGTSRIIQFNYTDSGMSGHRELTISGDKLYGNGFKVVNCGSIASVNETIESLNTHNSGVLCLPENSNHARSSVALTLNTSSRVGIIGHSSGTSIIDANSVNSTLVLFLHGSTNFPSSSFYVANLKFRGVTDSSRISISNPTPGSSVTAEFNNIDIDDMGISTTTSMISISNSSPNVTIKLKNSKIKTSGSYNSGISLVGVNNVTIENLKIETASDFGINIMNSASINGQNIKILNTEIMTTGGEALKWDNSAATSGSGIEIVNSKFIMKMPGSAAKSVVSFTNKIINGIFENNLVEAESGATNNGLMSFFSGAANDLSISVRTNILSQGSSAQATMKSTGNNNTDIIDFLDNSFVSTSSANNSIGFVEVTSGSTFKFWTGISDPPGGGNVACSDNGSYIFTSSFTNNGSLGGGLGLGTIPVIMNNLSTTSKRCKGLY